MGGQLEEVQLQVFATSSCTEPKPDQLPRDLLVA